MKHIKTFEKFNKKQEYNIDEILDKINDKGKNSLSDYEIDTLRNMGIKPSDLDGEPEYSKEDIDDFGIEWLQRRTTARKLYTVDGNNPKTIIEHFEKVINFLKDDKNPDVMKSNVIKEFTKKINTLLDEEDNEEILKMYQMILEILEQHLFVIYNKYGKD